jgi:hypothetical protein
MNLVMSCGRLADVRCSAARLFGIQLKSHSERKHEASDVPKANEVLIGGDVR